MSRDLTLHFHLSPNDGVFFFHCTVMSKDFDDILDNDLSFDLAPALSTDLSIVQYVKRCFMNLSVILREDSFLHIEMEFDFSHEFYVWLNSNL